MLINSNMTLTSHLVTFPYFLLISFDFEENATKEKRNSAGGGERTIYNYTYKDFLNCQPRNFSGTEGALGNEVQKLEAELWNLTVKGTDIAGYTKQNIKGNVTLSRPTKLCDAIRMSHKLMGQIVRANNETNNDNKRKREDDLGGNSC
ncbi:hypothetical protein Tco_0999390 [Tanacetum coccineum]